MSQDDFRRKIGFDADVLIKQVKTDVGIQGPIRVSFAGSTAQGMSRYVNGVPEIHGYTVDTVLRERPELSREEAVAKIKAMICEEACHLKNHETSHNDVVVSCTIGEMERHLSPDELKLPYISEKITKLKEASKPIPAMELK